MNCFEKLSLVVAVLAHLRIHYVLSVVQTACQRHQFRCDDGECIVIRMMCDGRNDCKDWSDETRCSDRNYPRCPKIYFQCVSDKRCIDYSWRCDDDEDCSDGSDEQNCVSACQYHQFECLKNKQCINFLKRCDGNVDCEDGSDERSCNAYSDYCENLHFPCERDHRCVPRDFICDGENDCDDGSDETHCGYPSTHPPSYSTIGSSATMEHACPNNYCLHDADCMIIEGEYNCICSPSFTGKKCENRISAEWEFHDLGIVIGISMALILLLIILSLLLFYYFKRRSVRYSTALMPKNESLSLPTLKNKRNSF